MKHAHGLLPAWVQTAGGVVLGLYLLLAVGRYAWRKWPRRAKEVCCHEHGHM
jgi:hypothetical protein